MNEQQPIPPPHSSFEDEINLFELFDIAWRNRVLLFIYGMIGLIIGIGVFFYIPKLYTVKTQVKIFQQVDGKFTLVEQLSDHTARLEDKKLILEITSPNSVPPENSREPSVSISAKPITNAPGNIEISASSQNQKEATEFLNQLCQTYCSFIDSELNRKRSINLQILEKQREHIATEMTEVAGQLAKVPANQVSEFEKVRSIDSVGYLNQLKSDYQQVSKSRQLLSSQVDFLKTATPAELCEFLQSIASEMKQVEILLQSSSADSDSKTPRDWNLSPILVYRNLEKNLVSAENQLGQLKSVATTPADELFKAESNVVAAKESLKIFAEVTLKQILAREKVLKAKEDSTLKDIIEVTRILQEASSPHREYFETQNRFASLKQFYDSYKQQIDTISGQILPQFYLEVVTPPQLKKTNINKKLFPIILFPFLALGLAGTWITLRHYYFVFKARNAEA